MLHWFRRLFERKGDLGNPPQALLDALAPPLSATMAPEVALRVPAVSAAVRAISEAVACLPLCLYRVSEDGARVEVAAPSCCAASYRRAEMNWICADDALARRDGGRADERQRRARLVNNCIDGRPRELIRYRPGSLPLVRLRFRDHTSPRFALAQRIPALPA